VNDLFQAEAEALLGAVNITEEGQLLIYDMHIVVYTYCKKLVRAIRERSMDKCPSWRVEDTDRRILALMESLGKRIKAKHAR
jgi:hypothetical protein